MRLSNDEYCFSVELVDENQNTTVWATYLEYDYAFKECERMNWTYTEDGKTYKLQIVDDDCEVS